MRRHHCRRQDGRLPCNNGAVALDPQRCCCPRCDCIIAILKLAPLPSSQWCRRHHQCHCPLCLSASWHRRHQCAGIFAIFAMANFALVTMTSSPLLMRRRVFIIVELALLPLPLIIELVLSPMLRWRCCHQYAGFLPLSWLHFIPNEDGIIAIVNAQMPLPLSRWCRLPLNNDIITHGPQWRCFPHCGGVVAILKLAWLPCFSLQKAAQVRLNNLGLVKNHSYFINNPKRIKLLEQRLELQHSIGRSEEIRKSSALKKELAEEMDKLSPLLSEAIVMYKANETSNRGFTKDHIKSILLTVFWITPPNSGPLSSKSESLK